MFENECQSASLSTLVVRLRKNCAHDLLYLHNSKQLIVEADQELEFAVSRHNVMVRTFRLRVSDKYMASIRRFAENFHALTYAYPSHFEQAPMRRS